MDCAYCGEAICGPAAYYGGELLHQECLEDMTEEMYQIEIAFGNLPVKEFE